MAITRTKSAVSCKMTFQKGDDTYSKSMSGINLSATDQQIYDCAKAAASLYDDTMTEPAIVETSGLAESAEA